MLKFAGIQKRTASAMLTAALLAILVTIVGLVLYQAGTVRSRVQRVLQPYAEMVISGTDNAVDLEDGSRAQAILNSLKSNPEILRADLVLANGRTLATYPAKDPPLERTRLERPDGVYLNADTAELLKSLPPAGRPQGHLCIRMSLGGLRAHNWQALVESVLTGIFIIIAIVVSQFLLLHRTVLSPIARLAAAAENARLHADYSQRVPTRGSDELALLGNSFNSLLATVEYREATLRQLSSFQRAILDDAAHVIISADNAGLITSFNPAAARLLGYSAEEVIGIHTPAIFHDAGEMAARAREISARLGQPVAPEFEVFVALSRHGLPDEHEWTYVCKDGRRVPVLLSVNVLRDERENIIGSIGMAVDITQLKEAVAALAISERRLQCAFSATRDALWEWDLETNQTYFSPRWYELLGYPDQEFPMTMDAWKLLCHPDDWPPALDRVNALMATPDGRGFENEFRMRARDGSWRWIQGRGNVARRSADGRSVLLSGTNTDISDRKQAEADLRERETKYRLLFENMITGFALHEILCDAAGRPVDYRFLEINPAFERLTGLKAGDLLGRTVREAVPGLEHHWIETFGRVALTGEPVAYENFSADLGKYFDTWVFSPKRNQFAVVFSDVSDRKKFEAELQLKNSLLEATLQATADGILVVSAEGKISGFNRQLVNLWHVPEEILATNNSAQLSEFLLPQLRHPMAMAKRVRNLNDTSKADTFDVMEFADGRVFERFSRPQFVGGVVVGRVWSFRDVTNARSAEAALRESENKFKTLFETANDAILLMNQTVFLDCNRQAEKMYGCRRDEIIGESPVHFSPERQADGIPSRQKAAQKIGAAFAGQPQFFEWIHCRADGTPFNAEVSLNALELQGQVIVQAIVRDITARKQAEAARREAEELYRTLVNTSPDGIVVLDLEGRVVFASPKALELHRYPNAEAVLGLHATTFITGEQLDRARQTLSAGLQGGSISSEIFTMNRGDGSHFVAEITGTLLRDGLGVPRAMMVITRDVTDRQLQEDELKSKNEELERFTYTVSHDLKSPLITIKGFAGSLLQDTSAGRFHRLGDDLQRIIQAADKMGELLNGLLELSRIGRLLNPPTEVSMTRLANDVVELLQGSIRARAAQVTVEPDLPAVLGDPQRLQEVLQNLLENALKFTVAGQPPVIEIGARDRGGEMVFFVRDQGPGIEPRFHETIFGLFNKLDARSDGTGIGLALVRRIIEFHGGRIWVESAGDAQGATFCFTLPAGAAICSGSKT